MLDAYCGAGGAARGYQDAGFVVFGVDIAKQRHYIGDWFWQGDALEFMRRLLAGETVGGLSLADVDAIHASPPCQNYTPLKAVTGKTYPDLIAPTRELLRKAGKPYVIENVEAARSWLLFPVMLCGTMFDLRVLRHRLFECKPVFAEANCKCNHWGTVSGNSAWKGRKRVQASFDNFDMLTITGHDFKVSDGRIAMGIDWMTGNELRESIPPAYTRHIGLQLLTHLGGG